MFMPLLLQLSRSRNDNLPTGESDVCAMHGIPWIYSAILAFEGQLSVFNLHQNAPDYRDLLPVPPLPGNVPSCAEGGVLGVLPGTMGCLQATEAIKLILGRTEGLLSGRVLRFDAMSMTFSETKLSRSPHRSVITELIDYKGFCGGPKTPPPPPTPVAAASNASTEGGGRTMDEVEAGPSDDAGRTFHELTPSQCVEKLTDGWAPWVLDVRLQAEHDIVRLPFTDRVKPHRSVTVTDVPKTGDVLVYCKAGVRGKKACSTLIEMGVEPSRLYNLQGGILQWQQEIDPSMPRY
jgi:sulfur-carrier protein adenylyltransferase/sulfurtransferase